MLENGVRGGEDRGGQARLPQGVLPLRRVYLQQEADLRLQHGGRPARLLAALQQAPEGGQGARRRRGRRRRRRRRRAAAAAAAPALRAARRAPAPAPAPAPRSRAPSAKAAAAAASSLRRRRREAPSAARPCTQRSAWARREWSFTRSASAARSATSSSARTIGVWTPTRRSTASPTSRNCCVRPAARCVASAAICRVARQQASPASEPAPPVAAAATQRHLARAGTRARETRAVGQGGGGGGALRRRRREVPPLRQDRVRRGARERAGPRLPRAVLPLHAVRHGS